MACTASARDFSTGSESSKKILSASAAGLDTSSTGKRWLSKVNVPELEGKSQLGVIKIRDVKGSTWLPDLEVDTEPKEFWATKLLPLRSNCTLHDVQPPFARFLRGVLEVDYEWFCVCD